MVKITWLGHSCFCLENEGYRIAVDPYEMASYPHLCIEADELFCSHQHYDHNNVAAVTVDKRTASPFRVEEIETFHDDRRGALRGGNIMRAFCADGHRIVHCGDLGHLPDEAQLSFMCGSDILMLPVGGYYTIDAATAKKIVEEVHPRAVLPMHYRHGEHGMKELGEVCDFTALFRPECVTELSDNWITVDAEGPRGILVPRFK